MPIDLSTRQFCLGIWLIVGLASIPVGVVGIPLMGALAQGRAGRFAYDQVEIGDSESDLLHAFEVSSVKFHCYIGKHHKEYSHHHGAVGVAIYYVADDRVTMKTTD